MGLDEFVKTVLVKVVSGIREAQEVDGVGGFIVPGGDGGHKYAEHSRVSSSARLKTTIIDFDVAVTVEDVDSVSGDGGLKVAGIGASIEKTTTSRDVKVSRIQFGIPILLPESQTDWYKTLTDNNKVDA